MEFFFIPRNTIRRSIYSSGLLSSFKVDTEAAPSGGRPWSIIIRGYPRSIHPQLHGICAQINYPSCQSSPR